MYHEYMCLLSLHIIWHDLLLICFPNVIKTVLHAFDSHNILLITTLGAHPYYNARA